MISIIYSTNRENPRFDWFLDSLYRQTNESDRSRMEIIFIDYSASIARCNYVTEIVNGRFNHVHYAPKGNLYQGDKRKTKGEYFSPSNARNTGAILANGEYLVFCDDVSVLMPGWYSAVMKSYEFGRTTCGAYQKHFEMVVNNGSIVTSRGHAGGIDGRWDLGGSKPVKISGGQMYGCSFCMPARLFYAINGFDELCDSIGSEDYQFGMRLNNAGHQIWYDRNMLTIESEELHAQPYLMKRDDRVLSHDSYMDRLKCFGVYRRSTTGNTDSSHMILDILLGTHQTFTVYNNYSLSELTVSKNTNPVMDTEMHWFDDKLLIEMT